MISMLTIVIKSMHRKSGSLKYIIIHEYPYSTTQQTEQVVTTAEII